MSLSAATMKERTPEEETPWASGLLRGSPAAVQEVLRMSKVRREKFLITWPGLSSGLPAWPSGAAFGQGIGFHRLSPRHQTRPVLHRPASGLCKGPAHGLPSVLAITARNNHDRNH